MFTAYPTYPRYRTLGLLPERQRGEDVYALQTALEGLKLSPGPLDGILGEQTAEAIRKAQGVFSLTRDGLAGGATQTALARHYCARASAKHRLPKGLIFGQVSHESGCRLGNYSPLHGTSYDAGVTQRNTALHGPRESFDAPVSIDLLGATLRAYFDRFSGVHDVRRRWGLAAGAWNAPAYAAYLAGSRPWAVPGPTARRTLEAYIAHVTVYLDLS